MPGKSKDDAFIIGNEIADAVTASNLKPIKLKFEKVLHPAILQVNYSFIILNKSPNKLLIQSCFLFYFYLD